MGVTWFRIHHHIIHHVPNTHLPAFDHTIIWWGTLLLLCVLQILLHSFLVVFFTIISIRYLPICGSKELPPGWSTLNPISVELRIKQSFVWIWYDDMRSEGKSYGETQGRAIEIRERQEERRKQGGGALCLCGINKLYHGSSHAPWVNPSIGRWLRSRTFPKPPSSIHPNGTHLPGGNWHIID